MRVHVTQGPPKVEPALTRVHFPVPVVSKIEPVKPPQTSGVLTSVNVREICAECSKEGFDEGAIVVRRNVHNLIMAMSPHAWGVVVYMNKYAPAGPDWKPLRVRWLSSSDPSILYNMDELLLIHPCHDPKDLEDFINCQDPSWKK